MMSPCRAAPPLDHPHKRLTATAATFSTPVRSMMTTLALCSASRWTSVSQIRLTALPSISPMSGMTATRSVMGIGHRELRQRLGLCPNDRLALAPREPLCSDARLLSVMSHHRDRFILQAGDRASKLHARTRWEALTPTRWVSCSLMARRTLSWKWRAISEGRRRRRSQRGRGFMGGLKSKQAPSALRRKMVSGMAREYRPLALLALVQGRIRRAAIGVGVPFLRQT